ncbi:unnamed protein product [Cyclocybe aegerita]|uniref:Uncharacterized protein n=1 Tax=Cyclocybe aegerita TaxID=1973307 RepID=A0A8S0XKF9_CYCAE|nr:unnamed protein product [Cyclocybe aegerita]
MLSVAQFRGKARSPSNLTALSLILVSISLVIKLVGTFLVKKQISHLTREYSYVGSDYPERWPIERKSVLMQFENPMHFQLDTPDGVAEWAAMAPGNGVVHLGPYRQPFTVSMLHQLKCLDVIRQEMVRDRTKDAGRYVGPTELGRHCLNYIRQMVTCRGDLELESFQFASHKNPIEWRGVYECKDWDAVFKEVRKNQEEHEKWVKEGKKS